MIVKTQVVVVITLTQISLYIRVDKENLLEFLLLALHVKTQVVIAITLTQISLYIRVDKENSLESSLDCAQYLYKSEYLYMFTDPT